MENSSNIKRKRLRTIAVILTAAIIVSLIPLSSFGADPKIDWTECATAEELMTAVNTDGKKNVLLTSDNYTLKKPLKPKDDLNIGASSDGDVTINSSNSYRHIIKESSGTIELASNIIIKGTTLSGGIAMTKTGGTLTVKGGSITNCSNEYVNSESIKSGGGISSLGDLNLKDIIINSNKSLDKGGGVYAEGKVSITGCEISKNTTRIKNAYTDGGGIYSNKEVRVENSIIKSNSGNAGGGIYSPENVTVMTTEISGNSACTAGGGIYIDEGSTNGSTLKIQSGTTISNNSSQVDGSGISIEENNSLEINGSDILISANTNSWKTLEAVHSKGSIKLKTESEKGIIVKDNIIGIVSENSDVSIEGPVYFTGNGSAVESTGDGNTLDIRGTTFENNGRSDKRFDTSCLYIGTTPAEKDRYNQITDCKFINNTHYGFDYGMNAGDGPTKYTGCEFTGNKTSEDRVSIVDHGGKLIVANSTFEENEGRRGIKKYSLADGDDYVKVVGSSFSDNALDYGPLMIMTLNKSAGEESAIVKNCSFTNNKIKNSAGGLYVGNSTPGTDGEKVAPVVVDNCDFDRNSADKGAGIFVATKALIDVKNSTFTNNKAKTDGGAIQITYGSSDMQSNVKENKINNCTMSGNEAKLGGAVMLGKSNTPKIPRITNITNTVIEKNKAEQGGAIYTYELSYLKTDGVTFKDNIASSGSYTWDINDYMKDGETGAIHKENIKNSKFTGLFVNAYNNYDVVYKFSYNKKFVYDQNWGENPKRFETSALSRKGIGLAAETEVDRYGWTPEGYEFLGWSISRDGEVVDIDMKMPDPETVLYAIWEELPQPEPTPETIPETTSPEAVITPEAILTPHRIKNEIAFPEKEKVEGEKATPGSLSQNGKVKGQITEADEDGDEQMVLGEEAKTFDAADMISLFVMMLTALIICAGITMYMYRSSSKNK